MYNKEVETDTNIQSELLQGKGVEKKEEEITQLFLFELDNELYAVSVEDVEQIMRIPPVTGVPNTPEFILGIFHLRGKVIVALDILKRMHVKRTTPFAPLFLFVSHRGKNNFAIVVDRIFNVIRIPMSEIVPLTPFVASKIDATYARGMFMYTPHVRVKKSRSDEFLIQAKGIAVDNSAKEDATRPVLWLNIEPLFNQEDIRHLAE